MKQYLELLQDILDNGENKDDRTGIGTVSVFGRSIRFDLRSGFPAVTTKKLAWKAVVGELLWFIEGSGDERRLAKITHGTDFRGKTFEEMWDGLGFTIYCSSEKDSITNLTMTFCEK